MKNQYSIRQMQKRRDNRKHYLFTFLILLLISILFGCNHKSTMENASAKHPIDTEERAEIVKEEGTEIVREDNTENDTEFVRWTDTHIFLHEDYEICAVAGEYIYGYRREPVQLVCHDKKSGRFLQQIPLEDVEQITSMQADKEGNLYVTGSQGGDTVFLQVDVQGRTHTMQQRVLEDMEHAGSDVKAKGMFKDSQNHYFLWYELCIPLSEIYSEEEFAEKLKADPSAERTYGYVERVYVKDEELNTLFYVQIPNLGDSRVVGFYMDETEIPTFLAEDGEGLYLQQLDLNKQETGKKQYLDYAAAFGREFKHFAGQEESFLYCQEDCLYEFVYDAQEPEILCQLSAYGISEEQMLFLDVSDECIEIISRDEQDGSVIYSMLQKGKSNKLTLTLGTFMLQEELAGLVSRYNREQSEIRIEPVIYVKEDIDYEDARNCLNMDILTGNAPDIIDVSGLNYSILSDKGIFVDLYECMEQDGELQKEALVPSVAHAYEIDGQLFAMAPAFQLFSMWGKSSLIQDRAGLNLTEFKALLTENGANLSGIGGFSVDEPLLTTLCTFGMNELINWDDRTCDFEGQYFRDILEFVTEYEEKKPERSGKSVANGGIIIENAGIYEVAAYQIACKRFGEEVSFVGYPTEKGSGTAVSLRGPQLAINSGGKYRNEAWDFIKYYLQNGGKTHGFPVIQSRLEERLLKAQEPITSNGADGTGKLPHASFYNGEETILVYEASPEDVDKIKSLIEQATNIFEYDTEIMSIIEEEAAYYFAGQKSIEEVAEIVQNRVSLYLAE